MTCEQCWRRAYLRAMADTSKTQTEHYEDLLNEVDHEGGEDASS